MVFFVSYATETYRCFVEQLDRNTDCTSHVGLENRCMRGGTGVDRILDATDGASCLGVKCYSSGSKFDQELSLAPMPSITKPQPLHASALVP